MDEFDEPLEDLKDRINALLWVVLPTNTTLGVAEALAVHIHDEVMMVWERSKRQETTGTSGQASEEVRVQTGERPHGLGDRFA